VREPILRLVRDSATLTTDGTVIDFLSAACSDVLTTLRAFFVAAPEYLRHFEYLFKQLTVLLTHYGLFVFMVSSPTLSA